MYFEQANCLVDGTKLALNTLAAQTKSVSDESGLTSIANGRLVIRLPYTYVEAGCCFGSGFSSRHLPWRVLFDRIAQVANAIG
jgi:hypothetical protein